MIKVLVIGFGSIGKRHAFILRTLGYHVSILSRHADFCEYPVLRNLEDALVLSPNYVVIANETEKHYETLVSLANLGYRGKIFIEKPLFHTSKIAINPFKELISKIYVGYVLRFHELIRKAKQWLVGQNIYSINCYCGQFLPSWRPNSNYKTSYSAKKPGGGVLRDLSHELDYIQFLTGPWNAVVANKEHVTNLEIETEDVVSFLLKTAFCKHITCQLNYWDHIQQRYCVINSEKGTCRLDFITNTLTINNETENFLQDRNQVFSKMHTNILTKNGEDVCLFQEALDVLSLIDGIEDACYVGKWISKE